MGNGTRAVAPEAMERAKQILAAASGYATSAPSCCAPAEQEVCCEPADKGACCGDGSGSSCGCK